MVVRSAIHPSGLDDYRKDLRSMTVAELKELIKVDVVFGSAFATYVGNKTNMIDTLVTLNYERLLKYYNEYNSMTVAELKELLKAEGKSLSGKKSELIERLMGDITYFEILQGLGKNYGILEDGIPPIPLPLYPTQNFIVRDFGINANDPNDTYKGLMNLTSKQIKKMFMALVQSPRTPIFIVNGKGYKGDKAASFVMSQAIPNYFVLIIMSLIYTNSWDGLDWPKLKELLAQEKQPNLCLNWNTDNFVTLLRRRFMGAYTFPILTLWNDFE